MEGSQQEDRFRVIYDLTRPLVIAYALRRAPTPEDAADVVAETFAIAWRRLHSIPEGEAAIPWLIVTARNVLANEGRKTERARDLVNRLGRELRGALPVSTNQKDERALVAKRALGRLSDEDRDILMLVGWDGFDDKGLSAILGCSPPAARIRLHRARARLVAVLTDEESAEKQSSPGRHSLSTHSEGSETHIEQEQPS